MKGLHLRLLSVLVVALAMGCATMPGMGLFRRVGAEPSRDAEAYAHFVTAVVYRSAGRFEESAAEMRKAVDLDPNSVPLLLETIQTYLRLQDFENARVMCERALKKKPDDSGLWIAQGWIEMRLERFDEAKAAFERAISLRPRDALGYEALILAVERSNDLVAAIDIYERLVELKPDYAIFHFQLGADLARGNDPEGARKELEKAAALDPGLAQAQFALGVVYLGLADKDPSVLPLAVEQFNRFIEGQPDDARAREDLAAAYARLGKYNDAIRVLTQLVEEGAAEPRQRIEDVYLLLRAGRCAEAADVGPIQDAPLLSTLLQAEAHQRMGQPYLPEVNSLDDIESDVDAECESVLNQFLYLFGKKDAGEFLITMLEQFRAKAAAEGSPPSRVVATVLARTFMSLERYDQAEAVLRDALTTFDKDKWLHFYLATVYEELHRNSDTEEQIKICLQLDPENPEVMNFLGYLYAEQNIKLDEAQRLLERALEIDPENPYYLDSLGWIFYRKGNAERAISLIRESILKMESDDAVLRDHLGDAYLLKGDIPKAVGEWQRARRLDPKLEGVQQKLDKHRAQAKDR